MPLPIALQLYSLREQLATDFDGVVRQVADAGFLGVETAGLYDKSAEHVKRLLVELGLHVPSAHSRIPAPDKENELLDTLGVLGCTYWVISYLPPEQFQTRDQILANCEQLNRVNELAHRRHLVLQYHNHWWEFTPSPALGGKTPFSVMVDAVDPTIGFEFDLYWAKVGGSDPLDIVKQYGSRAPLLHIKDGPAVKDEPMTAVGDGVVDYSEIIAAAEDFTKWLIVELDRCATDPLEAVAKSVQYLVGKGLGRGR